MITCCLLAADGVLQISGKRKLTSGKMEDKENGKTPAQLKDELSGLKMRALQQKAEEVGVAQDLIDTADDSKEDLIDLILAASAKEDPPGVADEHACLLRRHCHTASVPSCRPPRGCPIGAPKTSEVRSKHSSTPPHSEAAHNSAV